MARRSRDWNAGLAGDLREPKFAKEFLLAAAHEGVPLQVAMAKVARVAGVKLTTSASDGPGGRRGT